MIFFQFKLQFYLIESTPIQFYFHSTKSDFNFEIALFFSFNVEPQFQFYHYF